MIQLEHLRGCFLHGNYVLFKIIVILIVTLTAFTYFAVSWRDGKMFSDFEFWDGNNDIQVLESNNRMLPKWKPEFLGRVNVHTFEDWCGGSVDQLRNNIFFPLFPYSYTTINRLAVSPRWEDYGLRIFGYIHPVKSGEYLFAISSDENSEFWLSSDESLQNLKLMAFLGKTGKEWAAPGEYEKFSSQISKPVVLTKNLQYYFEIMYKQSKALDHVELAWRLNDDDSNFEIISAEYLSLYSDDSSQLAADNHLIPQTAACQLLNPDSISNPEVDMVKEDPRDTSYKIPLLNESYLENVFPNCAYYPIYMYKNAKIDRYDGINHVFYSSVYPNDYTRLTNEDNQTCYYKNNEKGFVQYMKTKNTEDVNEHDLSKPNWNWVFDVEPMNFQDSQTDLVVQACNISGNIIMPRKDVMPVIKAFMTQLKLTNKSSDLVLKRVINVEKKTKVGEGSRYLLEIEVEDKNRGIFLISKYFYTTHNKKHPEQPGLCSPIGFTWNPEAKVHVIIAVRNQGKWVLQFIKEMEKLYEGTKDNNFNVIIVDFNSTDMHIQKELKNAKLPRIPNMGTFQLASISMKKQNLMICKFSSTHIWQVNRLSGNCYQFLNLPGHFAKAQAVQAAIDLIEDGNSILFLCDLHIQFPMSLFHNVRKHTIQGKMVYSPIVMRMECGASPKAPKGFWETEGYGLVGIYKSDMDRIGGMNTEEFKYKWGGEDWELLDRIILHKLEVERLHLRNFVHFYHSKRGMWNKE